MALLSAPDRRDISELPVRFEVREFRRPTVSVLQAATIAASSGDFISGGLAQLSGEDGEWTATLRSLDRPGVVASMYCGSGLREVILRLADGRRARARIVRTRFSPSSERVCDLAGLEPFA